MTIGLTALAIYSVIVTVMARDARISWIYWRGAAKEARLMLAEERERGDRYFAELTEERERRG